MEEVGCLLHSVEKTGAISGEANRILGEEDTLDILLGNTSSEQLSGPGIFIAESIEDS